MLQINVFELMFIFPILSFRNLRCNAKLSPTESCFESSRFSKMVKHRHNSCSVLRQAKFLPVVLCASVKTYKSPTCQDVQA
jgi:hypothetical protein